MKEAPNDSSGPTRKLTRRSVWIAIAIALGLPFAIWLAVTGFIHLATARHLASISRAKADMRSMAIALEEYCVDHGAYPAMRPLRESTPNSAELRAAGGWDLGQIERGRGSELHGLTTPVSYVSSLFPDPFSPPRQVTYAYYASSDGSGWILYSAGLDGDYDIVDPASVYDSRMGLSNPALALLIYDPTNGAYSSGDIARVKANEAILK